MVSLQPARFVVKSKQELLELREFLPFGPETYKLGYSRTEQFIWTPVLVADPEFDYEIEDWPRPVTSRWL
jgi:hypothetical protein